MQCQQCWAPLLSWPRFVFEHFKLNPNTRRRHSGHFHHAASCSRVLQLWHRSTFIDIHIHNIWRRPTSPLVWLSLKRRRSFGTDDSNQRSDVVLLWRVLERNLKKIYISVYQCQNWRTLPSSPLSYCQYISTQYLEYLQGISRSRYLHGHVPTGHWHSPLHTSHSTNQTYCVTWSRHVAPFWF